MEAPVGQVELAARVALELRSQGLTINNDISLRRYKEHSRQDVRADFIVNEYLVVMARGSSGVKEELEMFTSEDLGTGNIEQSQDQLVMPEVTDCGSRSLGEMQRHPRAEQKLAGSGSGQSFWNMTGPRPKKGGHQVQRPWVPREQSHGDAHLQEFPGNFPGGRFPYERLEADIMAEIGLEELNGLEMEVMRRQMQVISGRLRILEDQDATWRHKEAVLFTLLVSVCIGNLWLWLRR
ncbi:Fetal and adult testis-expressed transcript protein homolog [Apodemus speciosus]|uniref:Fetal and adult testis-expressed transcript protein homolog n=1 Tax=Apodemus speciosus TaxID=105296 RepID=A0ABQ0FUC8_APOSI